MRFGVLAVVVAGCCWAAARAPLYFEPNQGQFAASVRFAAPGLAVETTGARFLLSDSSADAIRMTLVGSNREARMRGENRLGGQSNYLIGSDQRLWKTGIPQYGRVRAESVYPGVDMIYYGNGERLEFDLIVAPGGKPGSIALRFDGAVASIDAGGDLVLRAPAKTVRILKPVAYQERGGVREPVLANFQVKPGNVVTFEIGSFDGTRPLVIDPVLSYSTYLAAGSASGVAVAVDGAGNAYLTGYANSSFLTVNGFIPSTTLGRAAYVAKFNSTGTQLLYATYLTGTMADAGVTPVSYGMGIAVDRAGNAYVTGVTNNTNFPVTPGTFQPLNKGGDDLFVTKLNPTGSALVYSSYLGGAQDENAKTGLPAIAIDAAGSAYVSGTTASRNFPVTAGSFQSTYGGGPLDSFVAKFDPIGATLVYSSYLGSAGTDAATSLVVDSAGNAYVAGWADSAGYPRTAGAFQSAYGGGASDAFVTKVNANGTALVYSTLLGGDKEDVAFSIAIDGAGSAYVSGFTASGNFPVSAQAFLKTGAAGNAFVTKLSPTGAALGYSTYLGGGKDDYGYSIAVDGQGNAVIGGRTESTDFPVTPDAFQSGMGPLRKGAGRTGAAAFLTKLNATGSGLVYSTYFGGSGDDTINAVALDSAGNAYVTGPTTTINFPRTMATYEPPARTDFLAPFVAKFDLARASSMSLGSVISAANYQTGLNGVVSPGQIVTLFGNEIGPAQLATLQLNSAGRVDTTLAGVRVFFDDIAAPLIYVSAKQLSAVVPYAVPQNGRTVVQVEYQGRRSNPLVLWVQPAIVGIFTQNASGLGPGAILNQDGTVNSPSNPAAKGSVVVLFGTGEGRTQPDGVDGKVTAEPLPRPLLRIFAQVDNRSAEVLYAGGAPGLVAGVLQMNIRIPENVRSGSDIPIGIGGMDGPFGVEPSERVTIAIR